MKRALLNQFEKRQKSFLRKVFIAAFIFVSGIGYGQTISTGVFGQNAWWYDASDPTNLIQYLDEVEASGVKYVRIGGISANFEPLYSWQANYSVTATDLDRLRDLIDGIRAHNMEPIVEVGYTPSGRPCPNSSISLANQALVAANVVDRLNNIEGYNISYWIIANEPDHDINDNGNDCGGGYEYETAADAQLIAAYIKEFSAQMKLKDNDIKIIAPETAWYNWDVLDVITNTGGLYDVTGVVPGQSYYYVDILSFHIYLSDGSHTRTDAINALTSVGGFRDNLIQLKMRLSACDVVHGRSGSTALKMAVTEANINWFNPIGDTITGVGANSFVGGQFWAELMGICMEQGVEFVNFWSVKEGSSFDNYLTNIGYLNSDLSYGDMDAKKPTYYHFQLVAENFSGDYYGVTDNLPDVKAFACKNATNLTVMIMNQETSGSLDLRIALNNDVVSGSEALKLNVTSGGIAVEYTDNIPNQASIILVFDLAGNLVEKSVYEIGSATLAPVVCVPPAAPIAGGNNSVCEGATIHLTANNVPDATYSWTGPDGFASSLEDPTRSNATAAMAGTYSVTIAVDGCTSAVATKSVSVNAIPATPTAGSNSPVCQATTINLTANGVAGAYRWTGPGGFTSNQEDPMRNNATPAMAGTYSVTVRLNGCTSAAATTTVVVPSFATISAGGATTFCAGGTVTLTAPTVAGYTYQWIRNGTNIGGNVSSITTSTAGNYKVRIFDGICYAWSEPTTVTVNAALAAAINPGGPTTFCAGGSVVLYANTCAGYTYQWREKDAFGVFQDIAGETSSTYTAATADEFQVRVSSGGVDAFSAGIVTTINCRMAADSAAENDEQSISTPVTAVSVFPNPNEGEFTVELNSLGENDKVASVEVMNYLGQLIYSSAQITITAPSIRIPVMIDDTYPNGIYIVRVTVGDKIMFSRITVNR